MHPAAKSDCPAGWVATPNSCIKVSNDATNWWNAEVECAKTAGAHLASCLTAEEFTAIKWTTPYFTNVWIGLSDRYQLN